MRRSVDPRLLDVEADRHEKWEGSTALVRIDDSCPNGHGPLATQGATQGVLFRHGGYGAPVRSTWRICLVCFWSVVAEVVEINPHHW